MDVEIDLNQFVYWLYIQYVTNEPTACHGKDGFVRSCVRVIFDEDCLY